MPVLKTHRAVGTYKKTPIFVSNIGVLYKRLMQENPQIETQFFIYVIER